jgi:putative hydrolase
LIPINITIDPHCHTVASGHAYSTVSDYAAEASQKGLKAIAITDHGPKMPGSSSYLHFHNLDALPKELFGVSLYTGVELNILDENGSVDLQKDIAKKLDVVIAGLHVPCFAPTNESTHTKAIINTMKNPLIKIIAHLGDPRYPFDIPKVVQFARGTKTAIEVNNASLDPSNNVRRGGEGIVKEIMLECKRQNAPVVIGSDAHFHADVGEVLYSRKLLEDIGFPPELVINTSMERFTKFLNS